MDLFMMNIELLATCSALGYLDGDEYHKESDCLDTVKCLIRYLHNDDAQTRTIRIQLGAARVLQNDFLPILTQYHDEPDLFSATLRMIVNLTQPALICFGGKIVKDTTRYHDFLNVISYNQGYKEALGSSNKIWKILVQKIYDVLEVEWESRRPEDGMMVERILLLVRNLLHTPPTSDDFKKAPEELSSHDKLLWQLHTAGFDSLLLYMASANSEQEWVLHIMEIICLLLKEQTAETLAKTGRASTEAERQKAGDELMLLRQQENARKKVARNKIMSRHSRFGGTYVARGTKALCDDKDVIVHKSLNQCQKISFDDGKTRLRKAKNHRPLLEDKNERKSSSSMRIMLKEFCQRFLEYGYNVLMRLVKDKLAHNKAQDNDETYYFWSMSFFLEFNRFSSFRVELVSETLQIGTLHFVDQNMLNYYELMLTDKQDSQTWSRRMHLAFRCYQEFLHNVQRMNESKDAALKDSSKVLMNNIFYVVEYREIFVSLLRKFDERRQSRQFLRDIITTTHVFLKMFENYCKGTSSVVVQNKKRINKKRKKAKENAAAVMNGIHLTEDQKLAKWEEVEETVNGLVHAAPESNTDEQSEVDRLIFDPASTSTEEEQQTKALNKIQKMLHEKNCDGAIRVMRSARRIWPERDFFGGNEMESLREICIAELPDLDDHQPGLPNGLVGDEDENHVSEEEEDRHNRYSDKLMTYEEYARNFAHPGIIKAYVLMLQDFEKNSVFLNHCICKMLHRVAYSLKMYVILFQGSLIRIFQRANELYDTGGASHLKELVTLGRWVTVKLIEEAQKNPVIFAEVLFWKTSSDVLTITEGYRPGASTSSKKVNWTDEENKELISLFEKHSDIPMSEKADAILSEFSDVTRTRRQICNQCHNLGLVEDVTVLKRSKPGPGGSSSRRLWTEHDVMELTTLYNEFKDSEDPLSKIIAMLSNKKSKKSVMDKILSLELTNDRKSLYKKRKKSKKARPEGEPVHIGGSDEPGTSSRREPTASDSESDDETQDADTEDSEDDDIDRDALVSQLTEKCLEDGLKESMSWLDRSMQSTEESRRACERDHNTYEAVPLVHFTEEQEAAFSNNNFRKLLRKIGYKPPSSDQEAFWRLPNTVNSETISSTRKLLTPSSSSNKRKRQEDIPTTSNGDDDGDDEDDDVDADIINVHQKKRRNVIDDDEDE